MFSLLRFLASLLGPSRQVTPLPPPAGTAAPPFVPPLSSPGLVPDPGAVPEHVRGVADLSWQEFELVIGEFYRRQGYAVTVCSGDGADGGIDLRLERGGDLVLVQCKHWKVYKVSAPAVRELFGVMVAENATRAILVTTGKFTRDARDFAEGKALELIEGAELERRLEVAKWDGSGVGRDLLDVPSWSGEFARAATITTPECPFCRSAMVLRQAKASADPFITGAADRVMTWTCQAQPMLGSGAKR